MMRAIKSNWTKATALCAMIILSLFLFSGSSVAATPIVFFSDMTDGPTSGWEGSTAKGAAVSIWGYNLNTSRGASTITVCGVTLNNNTDYAEWGATTNPTSARGLQRITFWLNSNMITGPSTIHVTTADGNSNTVPFYCRALGSNHIYFVSRTGNDSNDGLYSQTIGGSNGPWFSAKSVRGNLQTGDVAYFRSGTWTEEDNWGAVIDFWNNNHANGVANNSITIASYPTEVAQIGGPSNQSTLKHHGTAGDTLNYWTFSKFKLRAKQGITYWAGGNDPTSDDHLRFIANDMSTYSGGKTILSFTGGKFGETNLVVYGNYNHDAGANTRAELAPNRSYGMYFSGYGWHDNIDVGWNELAYNSHGRGLQIYAHTVTDWIDNLYIHDNYIHDNGMTGVVLGGGDGGKGANGEPGSVDYLFIRKVYFYNNIIANNGDNIAEGNKYPALLVQGGGLGALGGKFYIYNNIFFKSAASEWDLHYVAGHGPEYVELYNNIVVSSSGKYLGRGKICDACTANNNLYFGAGTGPTWDASSPDNLDPLFLTTAPTSYYGFYPQNISPGINAGVNVGLVTKDFLGVPRSVDGVTDLGPYEYVSGAYTFDIIAPAAPANITVQ